MISPLLKRVGKPLFTVTSIPNIAPQTAPKRVDEPIPAKADPNKKVPV
jgi:hypothetical protein